MSITTKSLSTLLIAPGCNTAFAQQHVPDKKTGNNFDQRSAASALALHFNQPL